MKTAEEIGNKLSMTDKQIEGMVKFTKQLLKEYTTRIVENVKIEWSGSMVTGNVDKESITSQLPKFLKELE